MKGKEMKDGKDASGRAENLREETYRVAPAELVSARRLLDRIEEQLYLARAFEEWRAVVRVQSFLTHAVTCDACWEYYLG